MARLEQAINPLARSLPSLPPADSYKTTTQLSSTFSVAHSLDSTQSINAMGITTSRPTVEELQDALGAQGIRDANDPVRAVYEIVSIQLRGNPSFSPLIFQ